MTAGDGREDGGGRPGRADGGEGPEPGAAEERWAVDLHTHTDRSPDCRIAPEDLVRRAREVGLDRVAVTDHDRIEGAFAAREADPELVIVGEEARTADGPELIGLFLEEHVPPGLSFRETAEAFRAQGGITYLPHPFDPSRGTTEAFLEERADCVDLVEGFNARGRDRAARDRARAWARDRGLPLGAGSDAHLLRAVGRGRLLLPPFRGAEEFLDAARRGEIRGTESSPLVHLGSILARLLGLLGA